MISAFRAEVVLRDFGLLPDSPQHAAKGDFGTNGPPSWRVSHTAMIELLTTNVRHTIVIMSQSPHGETIVVSTLEASALHGVGEFISSRIRTASGGSCSILALQFATGGIR